LSRLGAHCGSRWAGPAPSAISRSCCAPCRSRSRRPAPWGRCSAEQLSDLAGRPPVGPGHGVTDPSHGVTDPSHVLTDPSHVLTDPSHVLTELCEVVV